MDIYQKLLIRLFDEAKGKDSENVDFADLIKREGFYSNIGNILDHFLAQIWITQSSGKNVRLTHWGVAEAKKLLDLTPRSANDSNKEINTIIAETRELAALLESFAGDQSAENLSRAEKKFATLKSGFDKLKSK